MISAMRGVISFRGAGLAVAVLSGLALTGCGVYVNPWQGYYHPTPVTVVTSKPGYGHKPPMSIPPGHIITNPGPVVVAPAPVIVTRPWRPVVVRPYPGHHYHRYPRRGHYYRPEPVLGRPVW